MRDRSDALSKQIVAQVLNWTREMRPNSWQVRESLIQIHYLDARVLGQSLHVV